MTEHTKEDLKVIARVQRSLDEIHAGNCIDLETFYQRVEAEISKRHLQEAPTPDAKRDQSTGPEPQP